MGSKRELTAVDLFAGAGGATAGLKAAKYRVLAAVEWDRDACATYSANHPEVDLFPKDIRDVSPAEIMAKTNLRPGELGMLTACPPCQGFSTLGSRNAQDPRNDLIFAALPFIEVLQPVTVAFENVPRLQLDPRYIQFRDRLRAMKYGISDGQIDAARFSVPQRRRRLLALAWRWVGDDEIPGLENETAGGRYRRVWVRDAWEDLPPIDSGDLFHASRSYPREVLARIRAIPKDGGSRKDLPSDLWLECHRHLGSHAASAYGRMKWDDVSPTLTTRCTSPSCGRYLHPEEDRAITLREAAKLQTFDKDYHFEGGRMSIEAQIGNAVPTEFARAFATLNARRIQS
jgi:DNA (cytosine-5)-methyltransferase 1